LVKMIVLESSEELFRNETIVLVSENPRCFVVTMATSSSWRIPTTSLSTTEGSAANANATAASDTPAETPLFSSSFSSVRPEPVLVKLRFLVCKWRKRERERRVRTVNLSKLTPLVYLILQLGCMSQNVFSVGFPLANISLSPSLSWQIADSAAIGKCKRTGMMAFHTFGLRYRHAACVRLRREQSLHRPCVAQSNRKTISCSGANKMDL
jgi:hypothetical protein